MIERLPVPQAVPREEWQSARDALLVEEKELTRANDRLSAKRRRLPMTEVDDYELTGPGGPVRLSDLFGEHAVLVLQHVMFHPDWTEGCPSCTYAVDQLPPGMTHAGVPGGDRLAREGVAFAAVSSAPIEKLEAYRAERGWDGLTWVSASGSTFLRDWGWSDDEGEGQGYSCYVLHEGRPFLTWDARSRGVEPFLATIQFLDRTVYGRRQDWEDSPEGWPQEPTYG